MWLFLGGRFLQLKHLQNEVQDLLPTVHGQLGSFASPPELQYSFILVLLVCPRYKAPLTFAA